MNSLLSSFGSLLGSGRWVRGLCGLAMVLLLSGSAAAVSAEDDTSPVFSERTAEVNPIRNQSYYVGLYYPGLTLGYQAGRYSFELRGTTQNDIDLIGTRFSHDVYPYRGGNLYWGLEGYHIDYEDVIVEGDGKMAGLFGGLQTYLGTSLSFTIDGGPYYVTLDDNVSGLQSDGLQFVVNTGINVHF